MEHEMVISGRRRDHAGYVTVIEDSRSLAPFYIEVLKREGFEVRHFADVDKVSRWLDEGGDPPVAVVLDLILPTGVGRYNRADAEGGRKTGLLVMRDIKEVFPEVPIVVLTNCNNHVTLSDARGRGGIVLKKLDVVPFELSGRVKDAIHGAGRRGDL